jgi:hypothetical protein
MEVVTEYADQRTGLEEKIRSLEAEKASLLAGIIISLAVSLGLIATGYLPRTIHSI